MAETDAHGALRPADVLPAPDLLAHLERAVSEVFTTMIGQCEQIARVSGARPFEVANANGHARVEYAPDAQLHVDREAVVEFRGVLDGRVAVRANAECAAALARGLLMAPEDEPLALEDVNDALKECANMLTGWVKSHALDPLGPFSMSVPFIKCGAREDVGQLEGALVYRTRGGPLAIELWRRAARDAAKAA